jgi:zinc transporter ZupT
MLLSKFLLAAVSLCYAQDSHDDHDHDHDHDDHDDHSDEHLAEFGASFATPDDIYFWEAAKVDGSYAEETMLLAVIPVEDTDHEHLEEAEHHLEDLPFDVDSCPDAFVDGYLVPASNGSCWNLHFDLESYFSSFRLNLSGVEAIALFAEHNPAEFENGRHYLISFDGEDMEPVELLDEHSEGSGNKWDALGAAFLVLLVTVSGLLFWSSCARSFEKTHGKMFDLIVYTFAAGALISTAFFLILLEAGHLIETGFSDEAQVTWRWGTCVLAGFLLSTVVDLLFDLSGFNPHSGPENNVSSIAPAEADPPQPKPSGEKLPDILMKQMLAAANNNHEEAQKLGQDISTFKKPEVVQEKTQEQESGPPEKVHKSGFRLDSPHATRVLISIVIGDFMHNFVDGLFIGSAFALCDSSTGWAIALTSAIHEFAQELADYQMLVKEVGFYPSYALAVNFLAGFSVIIGTLVRLYFY